MIESPTEIKKSQDFKTTLIWDKTSQLWYKG